MELLLEQKDDAAGRSTCPWDARDGILMVASGFWSTQLNEATRALWTELASKEGLVLKTNFSWLLQEPRQTPPELELYSQLRRSYWRQFDLELWNFASSCMAIALEPKVVAALCGLTHGFLETGTRSFEEQQECERLLRQAGADVSWAKNCSFLARTKVSAGRRDRVRLVRDVSDLVEVLTESRDFCDQYHDCLDTGTGLELHLVEIYWDFIEVSAFVRQGVLVEIKARCPEHYLDDYLDDAGLVIQEIFTRRMPLSTFMATVLLSEDLFHRFVVEVRPFPE